MAKTPKKVSTPRPPYNPGPDYRSGGPPVAERCTPEGPICDMPRCTVCLYKVFPIDEGRNEIVARIKAKWAK